MSNREQRQHVVDLLADLDPAPNLSPPAWWHATGRAMTAAELDAAAALHELRGVAASMSRRAWHRLCDLLTKHAHDGATVREVWPDLSNRERAELEKLVTVLAVDGGEEGRA